MIIFSILFVRVEKLNTQWTFVTGCEKSCFMIVCFLHKIILHNVKKTIMWKYNNIFNIDGVSSFERLKS